MSKKEDSILKEKVSLALLTYGCIRKISNTLYMSDDKYGPFNTPVEQILFNIYTGIVYERVPVFKWEINSGLSYSEKTVYKYSCNISRSKNNFVYNDPVVNHITNRTDVFTLYSPAGFPIFKLNGLKRIAHVKHTEYKIGDKYAFIRLHYGGSQNYGILYNLYTNKIEEYYPNIVNMLINEERGTLKVIRMLEDGKLETKVYGAF